MASATPHLYDAKLLESRIFERKRGKIIFEERAENATRVGRVFEELEDVSFGAEVAGTNVQDVLARLEDSALRAQCRLTRKEAQTSFAGRSMTEDCVRHEGSKGIRLPKRLHKAATAV